jgi:hypothetical protein
MNTSNSNIVLLARGLAGATLGAVVGWFAFFWAARQGFYMLALPGGLLGAGAGLLMRRGSLPFALVCAVAALALGLLAEWRLAPFRADASLGYFLAHLHQLQPLTLIMIALGGFLGFWMPLRAGLRH